MKYKPVVIYTPVLKDDEFPMLMLNLIKTVLSSTPMQCIAKIQLCIRCIKQLDYPTIVGN